MRIGLTTALVCLMLLVPSRALARLAVWIGESYANPSNVYTLTFTSAGRFGAKGTFVPRKVGFLSATATTHCFDANGQVIPEPEYGPHVDSLDLELYDWIAVGKRGRFAASWTMPAGQTNSIGGVLRKGRAHGTMQITWGVKGVSGYCSSGTFADPTVAWQVQLVPPLCPPVSAERRKRLDCVGP